MKAIQTGPCCDALYAEGTCWCTPSDCLELSLEMRSMGAWGFMVLHCHMKLAPLLTFQGAGKLLAGEPADKAASSLPCIVRPFSISCVLSPSKARQYVKGTHSPNQGLIHIMPFQHPALFCTTLLLGVCCYCSGASSTCACFQRSRPHVPVGLDSMNAVAHHLLATCMHCK